MSCGPDPVPDLRPAALNSLGRALLAAIPQIPASEVATDARLTQLRERTRAAGRTLCERLPVYPEYVLERPDFFDPQMRDALARFATDEGLARPTDHQSGEEAA